MPLTLHVVPHTHWDREWHLTFQQFRIRLVHLMDRLLKVLRDDAAYRHFMLDGQAILLEDYLEIRPERAAEIGQLVRAGRLSIGPWYVLPDEFLVAPESLVRNLMLGDRVCRRFGARMSVGHSPDPFGHIGQLPQVLRGFGIQTVAFRRGLDEEPAELWWDAPDGSRVLACYLRDSYDNAARLPTRDADFFVSVIRATRDSLAPHVASGHVLLLAGTDHQEPQPELPGLIAYANAGPLGEERLVHDSLSGYVAAVREAIETGILEASRFPKVEGELRSPRRHHLLPGVLSTRTWIKQRNDAVETLLTRWTEPFAAWAELLDPGEPVTSSTTPFEHEPSGASQRAHLTGYEPLTRIRCPGALIWHAWRLLLQNHPHDSICGCSVDQVHREMALRFDQAEQIGEEITVQSLATVANCVDTSCCQPPSDELHATQPVIVFNPTDGPRTDSATTRLFLPGAPDTLELIGPDGRMVPHQVAADASAESRLFFRVEVTPEEFTNYLSMVEGGRLLNYVIHQVELRHAGDEVHVLLLVGKSGEPDHNRITAAQAEIEALTTRGAVSRFVIQAVLAEPSDLIFVAPDLPPYGYATFTLRSTQTAQNSQPRSQPRAEGAHPLVIENGTLSLQANPVDGTLTLTDEINGVVYAGLNHFVDGGDRGDEYNYCPPEEDQLVASPVGAPAVRLLEDGPARQTMEIVQVYRLPRALRPDRRGRVEGAQAEPLATVDLVITSRASLYPGVHRVDVETMVDNPARDHRLRVHFPVPLTVDHAHTEAHFHVARRPVPQIPAGLDTRTWIEQPVPTVPQRGWADVSDGRTGLMVANRGLAEVEFIPGGDRTEIALTLLRCVGWLSREDLHCRQGSAGPGLPTPGAQCPGRHTFHYALIPHAGDWVQARAQADAFRAPLRTVAAGVHGGPLPPAASLIHVEPTSFVVTTIKQPEAGPGLIVRGVNLSDRPTIVRLRPRHNLSRAARVTMNEASVEPLPVSDDGTVTFSTRPWEIVTVQWGA